MKKIIKGKQCPNAHMLGANQVNCPVRIGGNKRRRVSLPLLPETRDRSWEVGSRAAR